jgi:hypothetical protein
MKRRNEFDDKLLEGEGQALVHKLVAGMPDEDLSMAWRSALNERLLETAAHQRRRQRVAWFMRPAMGLAFAGALAAVVMIRTAPVGAPIRTHSGALEAALVQDHRQNAFTSEVAGLGVNPLESRPTEVITGSDWSEFELESL